MDEAEHPSALAEACAGLQPKMVKPVLRSYEFGRPGRVIADTNQKARMSRLPRWSHRLYARIAGYFWLPCRLCARPFGGHEWRNIDGNLSSIATGPTSSVAICPTCTRTGRGNR